MPISDFALVECFHGVKRLPLASNKYYLSVYAPKTNEEEHGIRGDLSYRLLVREAVVAEGAADEAFIQGSLSRASPVFKK